MCTEKQYIYNKHANKYLAVKCGHCSECILEQNAKHIDAINREDAINPKRPFFLTLTYSDPNLPLMAYYYDDDRFYITSYSDNVRRCYGDLVDSVQLPDYPPLRTRALNRLIAPFKIGKYKRLPYPSNVFPVVCSRDIQLFFKRFTKQLKSHGKDSLYRKFYVSEYGPVHFRPHYHAILWLSEEQADFLCEHRSTLWPFGNSDFQRSNGGVASYLSTYTTSNCKLPAILQFAATRPRKAHSRFFGLPDTRRFIKDVEISSVFQESQTFLEKNIDTKFNYPPTVVFENALFPKCPRYSSCCDRALGTLYTLFSEVRRCLNYQVIKEYRKQEIDKLINMRDYVLESGLLDDFNRDPSIDFGAFVYTALIVSKKVTRLAGIRYGLPLDKVTTWHVLQYVQLIKEYYHQKARNFYYSLHELERLDVANYDNLMSIPSLGHLQVIFNHYSPYNYDLYDKVSLSLIKDFIRVKNLAQRENLDHYKLLDLSLPILLFAFNSDSSVYDVNKQVDLYNAARRLLADGKAHDRMKHKFLTDLNDVLLQQFNN